MNWVHEHVYVLEVKYVGRFVLPTHRLGDRENSIMVSISICQAGWPGSSPVLSTCFRKVEFYQGAIDLFPPVLTTGSTKAVHVLSCLCDNACKRSLAICRKSRALCPVSRVLSVRYMGSVPI